MKVIYEDNSERFMFQILDNFSFPAHLHTGLEIFLVQEGEIWMTVGEERRVLRKGDLGIAFPNRIHSYETDKDIRENRGLLILCPARMGGDFLSVIMSNHPVTPFLTNEKVHPDIPYALNSIMATRPDRQDELPVISAYVQLVLARSLSEMKLVKNRESNFSDSTAQLIAYLSENYKEPVTLTALSEHLGVSRYSVSRIFSEKLHTSFSNYINTLRIDNAKLLLQGSSHDILTIGLMCGYDNPRTFNREFKALCGCQPREYRKKRTEELNVRKG